VSRDWGWVHATDESDQWDGFNDSGIEHFRGKPIIHLAREIIQNSLDARVSGDEPVVVKIRLHKVPTISIPDIEQLRENIKLCLDAAEDPECGEGPKAADFFRRAYEVINKNEISVLEISDFNTSGIVGPCINGKPYYAFMKASGQSVKQSDTASGSYGIGKFAPYAVSSLRTIFVSTVYKDDKGNDIQLTQAKAILTSYFTKDKTTRKGVGFWGKKHRRKRD